MSSYKPFELNKSFKNLENIKNLYLSSSINPKFLLSSLYETGTCVREYKDFFNTKDILNKFKELNAELVEFVETKQISKDLNKDSSFDSFEEYDKHFLFFYKDNLIRVDLNEEVSLNSKVREKCALIFYYPTNKSCVDEIFLEYILNNADPSVFILNQEYGEFAFSRFSVLLPESIDLDLNYGKGFKKTNNLIINSINKNHSGLYMFHGPPGTGKSTYIKYLSTVLKKDVIFFPTAMVNSLTDPNIINLLIKKQNCVLVLEDAEKAIIKRESNAEASLVSTLLNMTDGILGDVLKLNIIVTYNCDREDIDEALLRRGRLKAEHSFKLLSKDQAKKLVDHLKLGIKVEEDMSLADIYNYKKEEELIGNREELNKKKVIGFNS
jgi:hypothetical protein